MLMYIVSIMWLQLRENRFFYYLDMEPDLYLRCFWDRVS